MTSIFFNSSSNNHSPYPTDHYEDHLKNHQFLSPKYQASSSSNSLTTHLFFNSNDQNQIFNRELQPPQHQHVGDNFESQPYNDHQIEDNKGKGVEFSTWNKNGINNMNDDLNQLKWMSSKMRAMLKMKKSDHVNPKSCFSLAGEVKKLKDHKLSTSPMEETYNLSNSTPSSNNNIPIRVCSDCNTTKTPLWRGGPRDHKKPYKGQVTKHKKRQYSKQITPPRSPLYSPVRKKCVEEFLVSLSNNLRFYPQDEKEAAILLMALSCGYAHES
ncbi:hypothetical protein L1987_31002 [Smallanthus sonchifolius]|uniref:Uncharacterized protein n=1 Tax=Smallanthus sonchifolius TaxID=185202 RepID=A0ACB9I726_9ASTR|nr:hypothetical protein L1987_31002 [Smallanthus sonchifolius]